MPFETPEVVLQAAAMSVGALAMDEESLGLWQVRTRLPSLTNFWSSRTSAFAIRSIALASGVVNAGSPVHLNAAGALTQTSALDSSSIGRVCGVAETSVLGGQLCIYVQSGVLSVPVPLAPGQIAWVPDVAGVVSGAPSTNGYAQSLGTIRSDGVLVVNVSVPVQRS